VVQTRHRGAAVVQLFGTPYTSYATLVFLVAVTALMCYQNYWNLVALVVIVPALVGGWYAVRGRVLEMARERVGFTGNYPSSPKRR
jgi:L-asparagine permease